MVLYFYILHLSPNMHKAVLHILGNTDSMNRNRHQFYTIYFVQYYDLSNSCATNQDSQCTYNVTLMCVRATIAAVGKAMFSTQPEGVFVALGIQQAMRLRHIVTCGLLRSTHFFFHIVS